MTAPRGTGCGLGNMRLVALLMACAVILGQDGGHALSLLDLAPRRTHAAGATPSLPRRRAAGESAVEDPNLCFSLRENEEQWQLLCNDRRSKFNFNPLSLRFGKRYVYRRAVKRARTNRSPPPLPAPTVAAGAHLKLGLSSSEEPCRKWRNFCSYFYF